ncbi:hypothetical protein EV694_0649 [Volucribacter psittacicida]|uniref:Penicillin-binding protein activator LpoA n=1 Tax=Volucribacter psittacicida TaxID=203482 RepID=A0A4R1GCD5_9PAST|nr:penicillin-binding protein activator [Volucribacter psittacicida]TCK02002.1 hypothetical protein EV694_0649 [Volucribacter psittacicida]
MLAILLQRINFKNRLMPFLSALLLAGCTANGIFGTSSSNLLKNDANYHSEFYLNQIQRQQNAEDKITYQLLAARVLVNENKIPQAEALLSELGAISDKTQLLDKSLVEAEIAAVKKENSKATNLLKSLDLSQLSASQKSRYYQTEARIAENQYDVLAAIQARIKMDAELSDSQRKQENNDRIWALLRNANRGVINNTNPQGNAALAGWLDLAQAYNDNLANPSYLTTALQNWRSSYPSHSAAYLLPTELQGIFNFQQTHLGKIGLLLPLSGNAQLIGSTVKAGFDDAKGNSPENIQVFDTMANSMPDILAQAQQAGITTLIGPLIKGNVDNLINSNNLQGFNILALNSTPNSRALSQVCYYGLAPEDEAQAAANKMWNDGIRQPLVIVPQNDLGQRTASAFNLRWQQLAATDANTRFYNNADDILPLLEQSGEVQALYIVALSDSLPMIKNAVDNSNRQLKLYASSRSHSGNNGPEYRMIMDGLTFSDIPFFRDTQSSQYQKVENLTQGDYSLMRLYAMGSDAWLLINQFNELRQIPGYSINGLTGVLSAGPNCNIERGMTWFQYVNGEIRILN